MFLQVESEILSLRSDILFEIAGFPVSNTMLAGVLASILLITLAYNVNKKVKSIYKPGKFQVTVEMMVEGLIDFFSKIMGNKELTTKLIPLIGAIFLYVLISNTLFLLIPGLTSITVDGKSAFRTHTDDYSTTLGLALGAVIASHLMSVQKFGLLAHLNKYIRIGTVISEFRKGVGAGFMSLIGLFVGLLDIIGEFAKAMSMSLRLFGNMFAGDLLMGVFFSLFAIFIPAAWAGMGLFSGTIQAVVFASLAAASFAGAVSDS